VNVNHLTLRLALAALALPLLAAPPATAIAKPPKPAPASAKLAREIAGLERTAAALSGEVAALTARTATLEAAPRARTVTPTTTPTPAPPAPAGGDLGGAFPDPHLLPKTVGADQLADESVDGAQVIDGSLVGDSALKMESLGGTPIGTLAEEDFASAAVIAHKTLKERYYLEGLRTVTELGAREGQLLTLSAHCPTRLASGGWKLVPGTNSMRIMESVPTFLTGSTSPEHDWIVAAYEPYSTDVRSIFTASGLCFP
jgi:hypothetical protein